MPVSNSELSSDGIEAFIKRWKRSGAAERANYQLFLSELCDVLGVERPHPTVPDDTENAYVFERSVPLQHPDGSVTTGAIDLYKRGCFVLEAKQGVEKREGVEPLSSIAQAQAKARKKGTAQRGGPGWDIAMLKAHAQAEQYARGLPTSEGRPPLLFVVDVGHIIEVFSEFTRTGAAYAPFPDPRSHRILLDHLRDPKVRELLVTAWTNPLSLDPAKRTARVTADIAKKLARLAQSLENLGHKPEAVATFLMRLLFTMFAEDVGLLPASSFLRLLESLRGQEDSFAPMVEELWSRMKDGGFSTVLRSKIMHFNGGLFEDASALPLSRDQFELLIEASRADWKDVEPAIFGTLLERALDPRERHKLGAHYTPRSYVERLVLPTVIEPLRNEWDSVKAAVVTLERQGRRKNAARELREFHRRVCGIRILDPACGSGNFLYVALEHLKRLEGEILTALDGYEQVQFEVTGLTVDPHQLLGLEVNPRAAAIAELVLWIGYLQWHFRTHGSVAPPEPIIKNFQNIQCRDAILEWDVTEPVLDASGARIFRWDGTSTKHHPITGEEVPDESATVPVVRYLNPRQAAWPNAEFIVGNPPFLGSKRMRRVLGDGYVEAVRAAYPDVAETSDFVLYWWHRAANAVRDEHARRFGFITTNSITQVSNRGVIENQLVSMDKRPPLVLSFAIPDHPWVDTADGAAVRVAMTVADLQSGDGVLRTIDHEIPGDTEGASSVLFSEVRGRINPDLSCGSDMTVATSLTANKGICFQGMNLVGEGFRLNEADLRDLGFLPDSLPQVVRRYQKGRELVRNGASGWVIDCFGLTEAEVRVRYPTVFQRLLLRVKPERDHNNRLSRRKNWWLFGEPVGKLRKALSGLSRYIVTVEASKFKPFVFLEGDVIPDHTLYAIASDDPYLLGILSSRMHRLWALAAGGRIGVGNDPRWSNTLTFLPFPFPVPNETDRRTIRDLGEAIDSHRKRQQALHPSLKLTDMYNVVEKLVSGRTFSRKDSRVHEEGLISLLCQLHSELDTHVSEAYGLSPQSSDDQIVSHLLKLNAERAVEEQQGLVRWLRPEFQAAGKERTQMALAGDDIPAASSKLETTTRSEWPKGLADQAQAVRRILLSTSSPADSAAIASHFKRARVERIEELLATLASLGQARTVSDGRYSAV
jgi:hypothetical protein